MGTAARPAGTARGAETARDDARGAAWRAADAARARIAGGRGVDWGGRGRGEEVAGADESYPRDEICPGRDLERVITSIDGRFGVSAAAASATAVTPAATF